MFQPFDGGDAGDSGAERGEEGGADDGRGVSGSVDGEDGDCGHGEELDRAGIDGEEGAHGVGCGAGVRVEFFQVMHGAEAEWGGGVEEAEHIGGDIHDHGTHGGVSFGDFGEESAQDGLEESGHALDEACFFGEPHEAEPEAHDADEANCERDGGFSATDGAIDDSFHVPQETAEECGGDDESQPEGVEHVGEGLAGRLRVGQAWCGFRGWMAGWW